MTKIPNSVSNQSNKNHSFEAEQSALLSIGQAAKLLNQPTHTLRGWDNDGILKPKCLSSGGHRRYTVSQLQPFIEQFSGNNPKYYNYPVYSQYSNFDSSVVLTSADYQSEELLPFKSQSKLMHALIANSSEKPAILTIFLGLLITVLISLILQISARSSMLMSAYQLQDDYLQFQNEHHQFTTQGLEIDKIKPTHNKGKRNTIWQNAIETSSDIFLRLTRLSNDESLDEDERNRANVIIDRILKPYNRLTEYIRDFEPGTVKHDVSMLLLTKRPVDYKMKGQRWSVRDISHVCMNIIGTKSASRSQVGRILKDLKWNSAIKPKLLSSDPQYGQIIQKIGLTFASITDQDLVLFSDEFKYTSSKVAEYLKRKSNVAGLDISLPFSLHKPFYKTKAAIQIFGLLDGKSKELFLKEMEGTTFDEYLKHLFKMLEARIVKGVEGKIYLIVDNAPYHRPKIISKFLQERFGEKVVLIFLPRYAPNHNPIERVWKILLNATERCGETKEELREYLIKAMDKYEDSRVEGDLRLHCGVCGKKWIFNEENDNIDNLKKHLCFNIEGLNPYTVHVLTHGLEKINLGQ